MGMRICFFFHRFDGGGAERITVCLANELAARGHEVTIAVRYATGPLLKTVSSQVRVLDMDLPVNGKFQKNIQNVRILNRLMRAGKYDVFVGVMADFAQIAALSQALTGRRLPLVCVLHNTAFVEKSSFGRIRRSLAFWFDRQYDQVITVSRAVEQDYVEHTGRIHGIATIYNPVVDNRMFRLAETVPDHPWLQAGRNFSTLVLPGRLCYQKNHRLMFETLKRLRRHGDFRLILLGDGEKAEELKSLAEKMALVPWIDFKGFVENPYSYMAHCDAVVLTSHYEGLPTVLIEAMACGSRIVSVDCPSGPREILEDGKYGMLVEMDSPAALEKGILDALQTEPEKACLKERALDFSVEASVQKYEALLEKVINAGKRA